MSMPALLRRPTRRRCLRCCCAGCCGWCCACRRKRQAPFRYLAGRCVCSLKVAALLLVAGLAAGCALGMMHTDPKLVPAGQVVLRDVKVSQGRAGRGCSVAARKCSRLSRPSQLRCPAVCDKRVPLLAPKPTPGPPQLLVGGVIGAGESAVAAADAVLSSLRQVAAVLDRDVDMPGKRAGAECSSCCFRHGTICAEGLPSLHPPPPVPGPAQASPRS